MSTMRIFDTPRGPVSVLALSKARFAFKLPNNAQFELLFDENGALKDEIPSLAESDDAEHIGGGVVFGRRHRKPRMQMHSPSTITTITDGLSLATLLDFVNQLRAKST